MDITRAALVDGTLTLVISHPLRLMARQAVDGMIRAINAPAASANFNSVVPFEIYARENV